MTDFDDILDKYGFDIIDTIPPSEEEPRLRLIIIHDLHPEDPITVFVVDDPENDTVSLLEFEGPDVWTEEEAKGVLQQIMNALVEMVESYVKDTDNLPEGSKSGSASISNSNS